VLPVSAQRHALADGTLTAWAFLLFVLAVAGLFGLVLWRVMEATLLRLH
jgi:type IV secretory pathway TrbD component